MLRIRSLTLTTLILVGSPLFAGDLTGTVTCSGIADNANAVVYLEKVEGESFPPPAEPVALDQKGKEFQSKVLPVVVGTTVEFKNSDPFAHNVFSPDKCAKKFDLGSWPAGETRTHTFDQPCETVLLCSIHPEMVAYVLVLENPYFAVTDEAGSYTIAAVPDGTYTVSVWHEELSKESRSVTVAGDTTADFTLKY